MIGSPKTRISTYLPISVIAAGLLIAGSGVVHGVWTNRWSKRQSLREATAKLADIPMQIGEWKGHELTIPIHDRSSGAVRTAVTRTYENQVTGRTVNVLLAVGTVGAIASHPENACFVEAGYRRVGAPFGLPVRATHHDGRQTSHVFLTAPFYQPETPNVNHRQTAWAWTVSGRWKCPPNPRVHYSGEAWLYKLCVTTESHSDSQVDDIQHFLFELLPLLEDQLGSEDIKSTSEVTP